MSDISGKLIVPIVCVALAAGVFIGVFFQLQLREHKAGTLPILHTGDKWKFKTVSGQVTYTEERVVTGEEEIDGKKCYVENILIFSLSTGRFENGKVWVDKDTLRGVRAQFSETFLEISGEYTITYSSEWEKRPFPLEVGKGFEVVVRTTVASTFPLVENVETRVEHLACRIEKREDITVPAGKFEAFKWTTYDNQGNVKTIEWYSDRTKSFVKKIDLEENMTRELINYSVS